MTGSVTLTFDYASVRSYDKFGRLHVALTPISKATVNDYYGAEIPGAERLGLDPKRKYALLRDPEELAAAAATSNNIPVMAVHIAQTAAEPQQNKVVGSTGTDAVFDAPFLKNSLSIWVADAIEDINAGTKRELSCSYSYEPDMTPGEYQGQPYDGVMRRITFNHVALVTLGRAGHDVLVEDALPAGMRNPQEKSMTVSRKALMVRGALATYLMPKLAKDAALPDLKAVVAGTTAANWATAKPLIMTRLQTAVHGKLAADAKMDDLPTVLLAFDAKDDEPDEMEMMDSKAKDEEAEKMMKAAKDKAAKDAEEAETEEEKAERMKRRAEAKDKAAKDKAARDSETAEEKEKREKEEKEASDRAARDKAAMDKTAMDSAIGAALTAERTRAAALRESEKVVRPWIGELALAQDSAEAVYKLALDSLGVKVPGVHPSAYRAILEAQPKPNAAPAARLAHDSTGHADFAKRFPDAARVRVTQ